MTPDQIEVWLAENSHKMDGPAQMIGEEPNAPRKPWNDYPVRWLIAAAWPYFHCLQGDSVVLLNGYGPARMESLSLDAFGLQADCGGQLEQVAGVFRNGVRDVVKVGCQGGFAVTCTPDHLIRVARPLPWRKHGPSRTELARTAPEEWVAARDLRSGDVLKTYYGQNVWAQERVVLPLPDEPGSAVTYPREIDEDFAWLLGMLATDCQLRWQHGRGMASAIRWTADDPGVLAKLLEVIPRVFGKVPSLRQHPGRSVVVELASTPLVAWLRDVVGVTDRRRVPDSIFRSPREVVAAYLCGLFDGDGEVNRGRFMPGAPKFSNSEESLVRDVYVLLMNMGAPVSVHRQEPSRQPGFASGEITFRTVYRLHALWAEDMDWSWLEFSHSYRRTGIGAWHDYQPMLPGKCKASGGVSFCAVIGVSEAGQEEVYDLGVPSTECFTANGIVVHNSAGNQSIPAVCQTVNDHPDSLADRWYLPETPRDFRMLERSGIGVFGVESKHPMADFDVVGTSISYTVLLMNFARYLTASGIPLRWRDREKDAGRWPMVIIGGQSYCAPGQYEPIADCVFLGEAEDEPGNGGLGTVCDRIAAFKELGLWQSDRIECYRMLAREFSYLYFPRFTEVIYGYEEREGLEHPSKQVTGYRSLLDGMRMPFRARHVIDMDAIEPLRSAPLLFVNPAMGAGDLEVGRGSVDSSEYVLVRGHGLRQLASWQGDDLHPHDGDLGELKCDVAGRLADVSHVLCNGQRDDFVRVRTVLEHGVTCTADHEISVVRGPAIDARPRSGGYVAPELRPERAFTFSHGRQGYPSRLEVLSGRPREWVRADALVPGADYLPVYYGQNVWAAQEQPLVIAGLSGQADQIDLPPVLDEDVAWLLGMLAGDVTVKRSDHNYVGLLRIQAEDPGVAAKTVQVLLRLFGRDVEPWVRNEEKPGRQTFAFSSMAVMRWLEVNFGITDNRNRRRVPEKILRSPRHIVAAYLSGFYDSDGTYDDRTGRPSFCSGSEELIRVVSLLMLNLGAPCAIRFVDQASSSSHPKSAGSPVWRVQGLQAEDGAWGWLQPSHTRRLAHVRRWQGGFAQRRGREACSGVIYAPVTAVESAGAGTAYDLAVPELSSFTCSGVLVHNCPAWCSFCRLSWVSKPYRQRTVDMTVRQAETWVRAMGSNELSPFSPDFPMHTRKKALLAALLENVTDELDTATMRIDDFIADNEYILVQTFGGMDSVTLGLEGNSQRMRDLVGKGTSDQDVLDAFTSGIRAGVRKFKFYMITNLPGEEPGDVMRIIKLGHKLAQLRTKLGQDNVLIQFSWTPLLIEAQTPMQWFASTPPDHTLIDAIDAFRDLKIAIKIGTKAEPNKVALFQLAQRASRDVGEAMCDVFEKLNTACWGGVPRTMKEDLEAALRARGFRNGLADCVGERFENDLFGWEFISTGVEKSLMWTTYRQMLEFAEGTDAETYDEQLPPDYHGAEFVARCDQTCLGRSCGACKPADLRKRTGYIRAAATERKIDLAELRPVDLTTQAQRVRVRLEIAQRYRQADPIFWRHAVRRAAYRAFHELRPVLPEGCNISKRSIRLATDQISVRDWSYGADWLDFALTRPILNGEQGLLLLEAMGRELEPWAELGGVWAPYPASAPLNGSLTAFYEVQAHTEDPDELAARFAAWDRSETVPLTLTADSSYFGLGTEEVDAKVLVRDMWAIRDDRSMMVRFLADGKAGPYQLYAALAGSSGWISHAGRHARRLEWLDYAASPEACTDCGEPLPLTVLGDLWGEEYCPRCSDFLHGSYAGGLVPRVLAR